MRRRRPRWIAAVLAFVLAFAQVVVAAHACPVSDAAARGPVSATHAMAPTTGCDAMPAPSEPATNACEAHCLVGQHAQGDGGAAAQVVASPPLVVRASPAVLEAGEAFVDARTPLPTPPPLLRCTRLLI